MLRAAEQPGEVHLGRLALEPVPGELLRIAPQARRLGENAGRDAAVVGADTTHVPALDQRHLAHQLTRAQSSRYPGRSATHHHHVEHLVPLFSRRRRNPRGLLEEATGDLVFHVGLRPLLEVFGDRVHRLTRYGESAAVPGDD